MTYSKLKEIRLDNYIPQELVDPKTGEILKIPTRIWIPRGPRDKCFVKVFDFFWEKVLRDKDIAKSAIRLWFWVVDNLDWNQTEIEIKPKEVARDLNVSDRQVLNWIKRLCEKGILNKIGRCRYEIPKYTVIKGCIKIAYQISAEVPKEVSK